MGSCPRDLKVGRELQASKAHADTLSENTYLAGLASLRRDQLDCVEGQLTELQKNEENKNKFIENYAAKLTVLGNEKRRFNELKNKSPKTPRDLQDYDTSMLKLQALITSMPFAELNSFKEVITHVVSQYDSYVPDRIEPWLPDQVKGLLKKALTKAIQNVDANKKVMTQGVASLGVSLDDKDRESLAQDTILVERFKNKNPSENLLPTACRVDAKYGRGAQYRDTAILAASVIGSGATVLFAKIVAGAMASTLAGAAAGGSISVRAASLLQVMSAAGVSAVAIQQTYKTCQNPEVRLGSSEASRATQLEPVCETDILKSQGHEDCLLLAALSVGSVYATTKAAIDALSFIKKTSAIEQAHLVGRREVGTDGTFAKVGNYTFLQKLKKARLLKQANLSQGQRRVLFESGRVGDGDFIDQLIAIEGKIKDLELAAWKLKRSKADIEKINVLRSEVDAAMDADPSKIPDIIAKLTQKVNDLQNTNQNATAVIGLRDILGRTEQATDKVISLQTAGKAKASIRFQSKAMDELQKAEQRIKEKFVESIERGVAGEHWDPDKIKLLGDFPAGTKGKAFEVRIKDRGHQRLFGCLQDGLMTIVRYDPHAPESKSGYAVKYRNLCD